MVGLAKPTIPTGGLHMKNLADLKALQQRLKEKAAAEAEAEKKRREL